MPAIVASPKGTTKPPSATPSPSKEKPHSPNPAGGFGILMLLLAALPFEEHQPRALSSGQCPSFSRANLATAANLRYCATLMEEKIKAAAEALGAEELASEEERRRRRLKRAKQVSSESEPESEEGVDGITIGSSRDPEEDFEGSLVNVQLVNSRVTPEASAPAAFQSLETAVLKNIFSYLPLRDIAVCRSLGSKCFEITQLVMPNPLPGSIFMRFEEETHRGKRHDAAPSRLLLRWICGVCSAQNTVNVTNCRQCQAAYLEGHGVRRVFFGQLRKERTAELVDWIIATVCPEVEVFHVENHTNGPDGRGKGCAWVYVTNPYDEQRLLSLNKRMFVDVDDDRREGVWYCSPDHIEDLGNMASSRAYKPNRPIVLARQPLVVERPQMKASPQEPKEPSPQRRWMKLPKDRSVQQIYEEHSGQTIPIPTPANFSVTMPTPMIRVGFPATHPNPSAKPFYPSAAFYPPTESIQVGGSVGIRYVDNGTRYVYDPYGLAASTLPATA